MRKTRKMEGTYVHEMKELFYLVKVDGAWNFGFYSLDGFRIPTLGKKLDYSMAGVEDFVDEIVGPLNGEEIAVAVRAIINRRVGESISEAFVSSVNLAHDERKKEG